MFVDPKGTEHTEYQRKVDGYCAVFTKNGSAREFPYDGHRVSVHLFLHTRDVGSLPERYREFWFDSPAQSPERLLRSPGDPSSISALP